VARSRTSASLTGKIEGGQLLGERQAGNRDLVLDRARLLLGDLGLQQIADNLGHRVLPLRKRSVKDACR
jgi:hypothetical protein